MKKTTVAGIVIAVMLFICAIVEAEPTTIVEESPNAPIFRVEDKAETYTAYGREYVVLPESIIKDINNWYNAYMDKMVDWNAEDGDEWNLYYGGIEEGINYAMNSIMERLGYYGGYTCELEGIESGIMEWSNEATIYNHELESDMALQDYIEWQDATFGIVW